MRAATFPHEKQGGYQPLKRNSNINRRYLLTGIADASRLRAGNEAIAIATRF